MKKLKIVKISLMLICLLIPSLYTTKGLSFFSCTRPDGDCTAPSISGISISPLYNGVYVGTSFTASVTATDSGVGMYYVNFSIDGNVVYQDTAAGYSVTCQSSQCSIDPGSWAPSVSHTVSATACDYNKNCRSTSVMIEEAPLPTISVTSPISGSQVFGHTDLTSASNAVVGVKEIIYYVNGIAVGSTTTSPYTFAWDASYEWTVLFGTGLHTLKAEVIDNLGHTAYSDPVSIYINTG